MIAQKVLDVIKVAGEMFEPTPAPDLRGHYMTFLEMLNSNDRCNFASPNESLPLKPVGRCEVCPVWQFSSITAAKPHVSILHLKYKKNSLTTKTEFACKFKGCNIVFSSHHSLRNHISEKDYYAESSAG